MHGKYPDQLLATNMNRLFTIVALAMPLCAIAETYKCNINGSAVYQDRPCAGTVRRSADMPRPAVQQERHYRHDNQSVQPAGDIEAGNAETERQKAFLASGAKSRKISTLKFEIESAETALAQMQNSMHSEMAAIEAKKSYAKNNLAGATYLNSLATERQAVATRYDVDMAAQRDRIQRLREDLAAAQR